MNPGQIFYLFLVSACFCLLIQNPIFQNKIITVSFSDLSCLMHSLHYSKGQSSFTLFYFIYFYGYPFYLKEIIQQCKVDKFFHELII